MSMHGPSNFPPRGGGPRFNNFSGPGGFMPMGPNQGSPGMMGPPPMFQGPGQQFEPPFMPPNQSQMGPGPMIGPPRDMSQMQRMGGPQGFMGGPPAIPPGLPQIDPSKEVWVETGTDQGKVYYYHAKTRKSVWKKPVEDNIQIITQNEAHALAAATAAGIFPGFGMTGQAAGDQTSGERNTSDAARDAGDQRMDSSNDGSDFHSSEQPVMNSDVHENPDQQSNNQNMDDTNKRSEQGGNANIMDGVGVQGDGQQRVPPMLGPMRPSPMGQGAPIIGGPNSLPNAVQLMGPPQNMIPPGGMQMPGMPGFPGMPFSGHVSHPMLGGPMMPQAGAVWRAHKAPDGRTYYYNVTTMETQWHKPKELEQMEEAARKATAEREAEKVEAERRMVLGQTASVSEKPSESGKHARMDGTETNVNKVIATTSITMVTEEERAKQKQRPVATEPVPGTPWCVVWTGDEKVFFYNPTTRLSMWDRPQELAGRPDIDKILGDPPHKRKRPAEPEPPKPTQAVEAEEISEDAAQLPAKKKKKKKAAGEGMLDKPVLATPYVPLEGRIKQFKEMLHERQVSAFSTWDKELHKIVFDTRYTMLNSKERRQVFDDYVKSRAEEERKEKKAHILKTKEDFKKLLEEAKISNRTSFSEFAGKHGKEPRFKAVERMKERESLFNEFMQEAKKKKTAEAKNKSVKIKADYMALLEEKRTEKYSRWSRAKEKISSDPRYSAVESGGQREEMWNEYCEQKKKKESDEDEEAEKKRRTEESMKARMEQVEKEKAERSREIDSERQKHRVEEAIQHFKALLADMVRNTDQSWSETRRQLRKEARWELASLISKDDKEKYFDEHIEALNKRKRTAFKQLLEETHDIELSSTWKEVKKMIKEDPRYTKFSSSDRKREREFDEVMKDKKATAKAEFRNLLRETKIITHKSKELAKNNPQHQKEIISILENDKRYLVLDCMPRDRDDLIYFHMDDLHRKGPPPPPTATEPSRRGLK